MSDHLEGGTTTDSAAPSSTPTPSSTPSDDIGAITEAAFTAAEQSSVASSATPTPATGETPPPPATVEALEDGEPAPGGQMPSVPLHRHKAILNTVRQKIREEVRAEAEREYTQKYGWAARYKPEVVEQTNRLYEWLQADPRAFLKYLAAQVGEPLPQTPAHPPADEGPPPPDLQMDDGRQLYSAEQQQKLWAYQQRQLRQEWEQMAKPMRELQQRMEAQQVAQRAKQTAGQMLSEARRWPLFDDLKGDIVQAMQQNPRLALHDAYLSVLSAKGMSLAEQRWQKQHTEQVTTKARASTMAPGATPATPKAQKDLSIRDLVEQEFSRQD